GISSTGAIVVGGRVQTFFPNEHHAWLGRFTPTGQPDNTFLANSYSHGGFDEWYGGLVVLPDDSVIAAGSTYEQNRSGFVSKVTSSGQIDSSFGNFGTVTNSRFDVHDHWSSI